MALRDRAQRRRMNSRVLAGCGRAARVVLWHVIAPARGLGCVACRWWWWLWWLWLAVAGYLDGWA